MSEHSIKYSELWEKIKPANRIVGKSFTTMRGYNPAKNKYYLDSIGQSFNQVLAYPPKDGKDRQTIMGKAVLDSITYKNSDEVTELEIREDTYPHWTRPDFYKFLAKFYHSYDVYLIILHFTWTEI